MAYAVPWPPGYCLLFRLSVRFIVPRTPFPLVARLWSRADVCEARSSRCSRGGGRVQCWMCGSVLAVDLPPRAFA